ncbi:MAG TPA: DUF4347 domain-containing protein, partial [Thermoguttaceae bacterium]
MEIFEQLKKVNSTTIIDRFLNKIYTSTINQRLLERRGRRSQRFTRHLGIEPLEQRALLSIGSYTPDLPFAAQVFSGDTASQTAIFYSPVPEGPGKDRQVNFALIDNSLQNIDLLVRSLEPNTEIYLYDHQQQSPTDVLSTVYNWAITNHTQIDSLSILSHGASGGFYLGNQWISLSNLGESAEAWSHLGDVMAPGGDIDLFACNLAAGISGRDLINNIGRLSGADVFASVDTTGYGGNWVLEAASATGIASAWNNPLDTQILAQWEETLSTYVVTTTADSGAGSLRQAISDANANAGLDSITFNIAGAGVHTISPTSALPTITSPVAIDGYTQPGASANT